MINLVLNAIKLDTDSGLRRDLRKTINDDSRTVEDYEYFLRLYLLTEFKYLDNILYKYRFHDRSLSRVTKKEVVQHRTGRAQIHHLLAMSNHPRISHRVLSCALYKIAQRMRYCPHCRHLVNFYLKEAFKTYPLIVFRGIEKRIFNYKTNLGI